MSATASFYLLDTSKLDDLKNNAEIIVKKSLFNKKVIDNYWDYLANNATELKSLNGSGYVYANLLVYLQEEKNIDLLTNQYDDISKELVDKRGSSHFLFTNNQRNSFLTQLDPDLFTLTEIQKFNQEFSEEGDEETARLTLDAIKLLHDNLKSVQNDSQILLLIVG
ncbi:hypothetical protein [Agriterribacter humi]|uniref:hypothetical protein n=1 Tax=Agriterribacter humi TaxID=1104781 RepID=UPI0012646B50|nr:hypothetical protein [Agriterribacter humi]